MFYGLKQFNLPEIEEKVLKFWEENKIFEKSLKQNKKNKKFVFFEGPPTANGRPGIHHILSRSFKDIILRYKTMQGFFVPRRAGWDTHGLPVEIEIEKKLGLKSKKEIENFGIAAFNNECKKSVWEYQDEWEKMTQRIGFWLDLKNPYVTYEKSYMETLWWILSQAYQKKLLYNSYKVVPWCTRCGTALSSHELALGYKTTQDDSVYVKFKLLEGQKIKNDLIDNQTYVLSWTTTPWTLPGNVALAINPNINYLVVKRENTAEKFLVAQDVFFKKTDQVNNQRFAKDGVWLGLWEVLKEFKGEDLVGLKYEPLFQIASLESEKSYKIYPASFVNTEDGTGVVHTAVMYGDDDYQLGKEIGLPFHHTVNEKGIFEEEVQELKGNYVKDNATTEKIISILKERNFLFGEEKYEHEYPFCWRCGTPLLYYARQSWFIKMTALKQKLLASNRKINWIPETIKEGRFGEWLREIKDWAISRERYWGTPLPIWVCKKCGKEKIIGSIKELEKNLPSSTNHYIFLRHGEALSNIENFLCSFPEKKKAPLTLKGRKEIEKVAKFLKKEKIDISFSSDLLRTQETSKIIAQELQIEVVYDQRLREVNFGNLNGQDTSFYHHFVPTFEEKFIREIPGGENLNQVRQRLYDFILSIEKQYQNKKILIVSHEYPIWLLWSIFQGFDQKETISAKVKRKMDFIRTGDLIRNVKFINAPRNLLGEIDLHKPYVDEVLFKCSCGGVFKRVPEVIDVWFDSGAMPFAQAHFPFQKKIDYPADYIVEGVDQTRGWFYTLLAIATLLGYQAPYKNVISLGLVLDKNGQKMSKSKGNIVNPWEMIQKYGADVVRWYFYTINPPGEPKRFDEADLENILRQFVLLLYNSYVFYETYALKNLPSLNPKNLKNILDKWIYIRLLTTKKEVEDLLEKYEIGKAGKAIEELVNDLSKWYIRRSRRRFQKPENKNDYKEASQTLQFVLLEISKMLAPFMPFFAEALFKSLVSGKNKSVHLEKWSKSYYSFAALEAKNILSEMKTIQEIASSVLSKRVALGIKVRQPLKSLTLSFDMGNKLKKYRDEVFNVLKEEINVKEIKIDKNLKEEFVLDTNITIELKTEGILREVIRNIQGLRQDAKLKPKEKALLYLHTTSSELKDLLLQNEKFLKKEVNVSQIIFNQTQKFTVELATKINGVDLWMAIQV